MTGKTKIRLEGVSIDIDLQPIEQHIETMVDRAKKPVLAMMLRDTTEYVPMNTGNLRESGKTTPDGLEWTAEYAGEVYYSDAPHVVGTREWFEAAKAVHMADWIKSFQNELNRGK